VHLFSLLPRLKVIHLNPNDPSPVVTSSSTAIFRSLPIDNPIARVLVSLIEKNRELCGDGGLFMLAFAAGLLLFSAALLATFLYYSPLSTRLLEKGLMAVEKQGPHMKWTFLSAYQVALEWALHFMKGP